MSDASTTPVLSDVTSAASSFAPSSMPAIQTATPDVPEAVETTATANPTPISAIEPHPVEIPSLLEDVGKKPETKTEEPAKTETVTETVTQTPELAAIEWEFKIPETLKADDATLGRFRETLTSLLRPKDGETPSHAAQRLVDMHNEALAAYDKTVAENQIKAWNATRKQWRTSAMADEMIGGSGHETSMGVVARVRDTLVSDAKPGSKQYNADVKEVQDFLRITGAGDHPAFLKMLYRAGRYVDEAPPPKFTGSPPPDAGRRPGRRLYADDSSR